VRATSLYPLRFEPIYRYRLWGGRRLANLLSAPLPQDELVGEAWILSDRDEAASRVADGPLKGHTIAELLAQSPQQMLGASSVHFTRFPLLLKFLDVKERLSVQVHPAGKTEAWVVLEAGPAARVFAGLKPQTTAAGLRHAIAAGTVADRLAGFTPKPGDAIFIPAGTVHSARDIVVFEVQQNSDVTLRLYDWEQRDVRTGAARPLQVEQALSCIDFEQGAVIPLVPIVTETQPMVRESLFRCPQFRVTRIGGQAAFIAGATQAPHVLVCLVGEGLIDYGGTSYPFRAGDAVLLAPAVGACHCRPRGTVTLLEISLPDIS